MAHDTHCVFLFFLFWLDSHRLEPTKRCTSWFYIEFLKENSTINISGTLNSKNQKALKLFKLSRSTSSSFLASEGPNLDLLSQHPTPVYLTILSRNKQGPAACGDWFPSHTVECVGVNRRRAYCFELIKTTVEWGVWGSKVEIYKRQQRVIIHMSSPKGSWTYLLLEWRHCPKENNMQVTGLIKNDVRKD